MSSYTPFLTENIYQSLRNFLPASEAEHDARSVHFLRFPEVKLEYLDPGIERRVKRMQSVIELTRAIRERMAISLKTPLRELTVFHPDEEYLDDLRSLERYIKEELNVQLVHLSSDEAECGIQYKASADWPTLGRKLRGNLGRVKAGLQTLTSEDVKKYSSTGKLTVDGIELVSGDLLVTRFVDALVGDTVASNSDTEVVVLLDIQIYPDLFGEWFTRELINRVQRLRKKAALQATDEVNIYYTVVEGERSHLVNAIGAHRDMLAKALRGIPMEATDALDTKTVLIVEEQEISDTKFKLIVTKCR